MLAVSPSPFTPATPSVIWREPSSTESTMLRYSYVHNVVKSMCCISGHLWIQVLRWKHPDRSQSNPSHEFLLLWTGLTFINGFLLFSQNVQQDAVCLLGGSEGPKGVYEGNVYVGFGGSSAKPVCDDSWDATDGQVVCRQLGFFGLVKTFLNLNKRFSGE